MARFALVVTMLRGLCCGIVAALLATFLVAPAGSADHCDTKITVYGRIALAPVAPPPYASSTHGVCVRLFGDNGVEDHLLPPNTDEVMVRVNGDFGPRITTLRATLTGLGFTGHEHPLVRTLNQLGGYTYNSAWISLPDGPTDGALTVAVTQPGAVRTITYHTTATLLVPSLPPPPPPPPLPPP